MPRRCGSSSISPRGSKGCRSHWSWRCGPTIPRPERRPWPDCERRRRLVCCNSGHCRRTTPSASFAAASSPTPTTPSAAPPTTCPTGNPFILREVLASVDLDGLPPTAESAGDCAGHGAGLGGAGDPDSDRPAATRGDGGGRGGRRARCRRPRASRGRPGRPRPRHGPGHRRRRWWPPGCSGSATRSNSPSRRCGRRSTTASIRHGVAPSTAGPPLFWSATTTPIRSGSPPTFSTARRSGDAEVVERLRGAARRALAIGAPDVAGRYLRRALVEPPPGASLPAVLQELGRIGAMTGDPDAAAYLGRAAGLMSEPAARATALGEPRAGAGDQRPLRRGDRGPAPGAGRDGAGAVANCGAACWRPCSRRPVSSPAAGSPASSRAPGRPPTDGNGEGTTTAGRAGPPRRTGLRVAAGRRPVRRRALRGPPGPGRGGAPVGRRPRRPALLQRRRRPHLGRRPGGGRGVARPGGGRGATAGRRDGGGHGQLPAGGGQLPAGGSGRGRDRRPAGRRRLGLRLGLVPAGRPGHPGAGADRAGGASPGGGGPRRGRRSGRGRGTAPRRWPSSSRPGPRSTWWRAPRPTPWPTP